MGAKVERTKNAPCAAGDRASGFDRGPHLKRLCGDGLCRSRQYESGDEQIKSAAQDSPASPRESGASICGHRDGALVNNAHVNRIGVAARHDADAVPAALDTAIQRVVIHAAGGGGDRQRRVVGDDVTEAAVAVEAIGYALRRVGGVDQVTRRRAGGADYGTGRGGVGVTSDLHGIAGGGALNAEAVSARSASELGGQFGEGRRVFTEVQRTEVDPILAGRSVDQAAIR